MAERTKAYMNWSGGKDAMLALHRLLEDKKEAVDLLLTTINGALGRVSMHGLRRDVLEAQTRAIGLALDVVELPAMPSMDAYSRIMEEKVADLKARAYTHAVFGDIFLADIRRYRESMLQPYGITALFPLWQGDTRRLALEFIRLGYRAIVICVDTVKLDVSFLGCEFDRQWLDRLPKDVDPCGENGEFHTFCFDGPLFAAPVSVKRGKTVFKSYPNPSAQQKEDALRFAFCDLVAV